MCFLHATIDAKRGPQVLASLATLERLRARSDGTSAMTMTVAAAAKGHGGGGSPSHPAAPLWSPGLGDSSDEDTEFPVDDDDPNDTGGGLSVTAAVGASAATLAAAAAAAGSGAGSADDDDSRPVGAPLVVTGCYLRYADLSSIFLDRTIIRGADLRDSSFRGSRLVHCAFPACELDGVDFSRATLDGTDLSACASMRAPVLHLCRLDGARMPPLHRMSPDGSSNWLAWTISTASQPLAETEDPLSPAAAWAPWRQRISLRRGGSSRGGGSGGSGGGGGLLSRQSTVTRSDPARQRAVYRALKECYKRSGEHAQAGIAYAREMDCKRLSSPFALRAVLTLLWLACGYGERAGRLLALAVVQILVFAVLLSLSPLETADGGSGAKFADALYLSMSTFTTLGSGEVLPRGIARLWVAIEGLLGAFSMALLVFVFSRKMSR
jgi:hypothetical protein